MNEDIGSPPAASSPTTPLDLVAVVASVASVAVLMAGVLAALALSDIRDVDGTERFRLLAQAASPSVAAFALVGVAMIVHGRRSGEGGGGWTSSQIAPGAALGIGAGVALVAALLALNGVVVDLTQEGAPGLYRLGNVIGRFATITLCGLALWLAATAPARRGSLPLATPPPSPPGAPDPSSPA